VLTERSTVNRLEKQMMHTATKPSGSILDKIVRTLSEDARSKRRLIFLHRSMLETLIEDKHRAFGQDKHALRFDSIALSVRPVDETAVQCLNARQTANAFKGESEPVRLTVEVSLLVEPLQYQNRRRRCCSVRTIDRIVGERPARHHVPSLARSRTLPRIVATPAHDLRRHVVH